MLSIKTCYAHLLKSHSPLYFCLKKIPKEKRDVIVAIEFFYDTLRQILLKTERSVAILKLQWFKMDILKIKNQEAEHPLNQLLQSYAVPADYLLEIAEGLLESFALSQPLTNEEIMIHVMRTGGVRERLILLLLNLKIDTEILYQAAFIFEYTYYLQHLRAFVKKELIFFDHQEMQRFAVNASDWYAFKTTSAIKELILLQIQKLMHTHVLIRPNINFSFLNVRLAIANTLLEEIKIMDARTLENYIQLTPLKMWWIGFCH